MKNYIIRFDDTVAQQINDHVRLAKQIWRHAKPDLENVRIAAGSVASYGKHLANCSANGVIQIPVGNSFSVLTYSDENTLVHKQADETELLGVLLHELGHHVINTAKLKPWKGAVHAGQSTHLFNSWLWICATGWNYMHGTELTVDDIARSIRLDDTHKWHDRCRSFNPYVKPLDVIERAPSLCEHCGESFVAARSDAKYCSTKCRVYANRGK